MIKEKYYELTWMEKEYYKRVTEMNTTFITVLRNRISCLEAMNSELERIIAELKEIEDK